VCVNKPSLMSNNEDPVPCSKNLRSACCLEGYTMNKLLTVIMPILEPPIKPSAPNTVSKTTKAQNILILQPQKIMSLKPFQNWSCSKIIEE
jgi:hypothetical protein